MGPSPVVAVINTNPDLVELFKLRIEAAGFVVLLIHVAEIRAGLDIGSVVEQHDPTVIVSSQGFINHADHRATGLAAVDAVYPFARSYLQYPEQIAEGLEPHTVPELYLWGANPPNFWVDVSDTLECKVEALSCHQSQFKDVERTKQFVTERLHQVGEEHGVQYAETFRRLEFRRR